MMTQDITPHFIRKESPHWKDFYCKSNFKSQVESEIDEEYLVGGVIAKNENVIVARVALYLNPYHILDGKQAITFGYFDCIENFDVFKSLANAIFDVCKQYRCKQIIGPINGSTWNSYRFTIGAIEHPFLLEPFQPEYYLSYFNKIGFQTLANYQSNLSIKLLDNKLKTENRLQYFNKLGISFENFDTKNAVRDFKEIANLCNHSFKDNFLFSPISEEKFVDKMTKLLPILNEKLVLIARHENKIVGFLLSYHDKYNKDKKTIVIKTLARNIDPIHAGLGSVLSSLIMSRAISLDYENCIHALMIKTNTSTKISDKFDGVMMRQYILLKYSIK